VCWIGYWNADLEVKQTYNFGQAFVRMVKYCFSKSLEPWLKAGIENNILELGNFAKGLQKDKDAIME